MVELEILPDNEKYVRAPGGDPWSLFMRPGDVIFTRASTKPAQALIGGLQQVLGHKPTAPHHVVIVLREGVIMEAQPGKVTLPVLAATTPPFSVPEDHDRVALVLRHCGITRDEEWIERSDEVGPVFQAVWKQSSDIGDDNGFGLNFELEELVPHPDAEANKRKKEALELEHTHHIAKLNDAMIDMALRRVPYPNLLFELPSKLLGKGRSDKEVCTEIVASMMHLLRNAGLLDQVEQSVPDGDRARLPILPADLAEAFRVQGFEDVTFAYRTGLAGKWLEAMKFSDARAAHIDNYKWAAVHTCRMSSNFMTIAGMKESLRNMDALMKRDNSEEE